MRLLLISNSGRPYLEHCRTTMVEFLGPIKRLSFIAAAPFIDEKVYCEKVTAALSPAGLTIEHLDLKSSPLQTLAKAQAILVGGGNTYRLLKSVREVGLLKPLRERVLAGLPYIGWSAGANLAGPTILTTNDWNVVGLKDFEALQLVPFNINPHYIETDPKIAQFSETRDDRIAEYHKVNDNPVLGIEEQTSLWVENGSVKVVGQGRVRRFEPGKTPQDYRNQSQLTFS